MSTLIIKKYPVEEDTYDVTTKLSRTLCSPLHVTNEHCH
jgi:hypothetical protein